jgi:hypothetical protein
MFAGVMASAEAVEAVSVMVDGSLYSAKFARVTHWH